MCSCLFKHKGENMKKKNTHAGADIEALKALRKMIKKLLKKVRG